MPRKPFRPRAVVSVSVPLEPDYVRANRAAGMTGETLAEFVRAAIRDRADLILGHDAADDAPTTIAA